MLHPAKQPARGELREGAPSLPVADGGIGVGNGGRWDEDCRAGWELDNKVEIPENQMASFRRIEVTQRGDCTPPEREVSKVAMFL